MRFASKLKLTGVLLAGAFLGLFAANSFAAGTASGTTISNTATVNYSVGGVAQTAIGSSPTGNTAGAGTATTFLVDNKLDITVVHADSGNVKMAPGSTAQYLTFTVTNNGNSTQGVSFTTVQEASGATIAAPFTGPTSTQLPNPNVQVFVANGHSGAYVPGTDTASSIPQLAPGASATVYIVSSIPNTLADGAIAVEALVGQVAAPGASATYGTAPGGNITSDDSGTTWTPGTVQQIFADAAGTDDAVKDGKSSDREAYTVQSSSLTITKGTPVILSDPTGDAKPHAIPGAVMQYTVTIANSGSASTAATSVAMTDGLPANTSWGTSGTGTLTVTTPGVNGGAAFACPDGSVTSKTGTAPYTNVSCDFNKTTANTITVQGVYLKPGDTTTIVYTVTIN